MSEKQSPDFNTIETSAAHNLLGKELADGWKVIEKITKHVLSTGSFFSVCYKVQKEGEIAFLKAFDFASFFKFVGTDKSVVDAMSHMTNAFQFERDLSQYCKERYVTKVSIAKSSGELRLEGFGLISNVPYLIFELADGNIRDIIAYNGKMEDAILFKSLHSIAVGLKQLHMIKVSHNDVKPSNILVFGSDHQLGDLGSSTCSNIRGPHDDLLYAGDWTYAPPEILYRYVIPERSTRTFLIDLYLFGSMFSFYFTGASMTSTIIENLSEEMAPTRWPGRFEQVKDYLLEAFSKSLVQISDSIDEKYRKDVLLILEKVCFPIPERRGFGFPSKAVEVKYTFENLISILNRLHLQATLNFYRN